MIGNNELRFNEASMIEAVQEYLNKRLTGETLRVTSVSKSSGYPNDTFVIKTTSDENRATPTTQGN